MGIIEFVDDAADGYTGEPVLSSYAIDTYDAFTAFEQDNNIYTTSVATADGGAGDERSRRRVCVLLLGADRDRRRPGGRHCAVGHGRRLEQRRRRLRQRRGDVGGGGRGCRRRGRRVVPRDLVDDVVLH